ncbi:hypothetical protein L7F22_041598 [Adiantum nelumboides]|nr:hypothetical protein [Adiantum nelumboides]
MLTSSSPSSPSMFKPPSPCPLPTHHSSRPPTLNSSQPMGPVKGRAKTTKKKTLHLGGDEMKEDDHQDDNEDDHPPPFSKRLWGNVPTHGVLESTSKFALLLEKLSICFAASGGLCNLIETVCQLPEDYNGDVCTIHVNDANPKVALRNFFMLELLRMYGDEAIDAVIALWYSIGITTEQLRAAKAVARKVHNWPWV